MYSTNREALSDLKAQIAELDAEQAALKSILTDCQSALASSISPVDIRENGMEESQSIGTLNRPIRNDQPFGDS